MIHLYSVAHDESQVTSRCKSATNASHEAQNCSDKMFVSEDLSTERRMNYLC